MTNVEQATNWGEAVTIFILGIGTVFAVLIVLWAILALMKIFFAKSSAEESATAVKSAAPAPAQAPAQPERKMSAPKVVASAAPSNEDELVAILTAAIAADANSTDLRVKSYKRI